MRRSVYTLQASLPGTTAPALACVFLARGRLVRVMAREWNLKRTFLVGRHLAVFSERLTLGGDALEKQVKFLLAYSLARGVSAAVSAEGVHFRPVLSLGACAQVFFLVWSDTFWTPQTIALFPSDFATHPTFPTYPRRWPQLGWVSEASEVSVVQTLIAKQPTGKRSGVYTHKFIPPTAVEAQEIQALKDEILRQGKHK